MQPHLRAEFRAQAPDPIETSPAMLKALLKGSLLPSGEQPMGVRAGLYRGLQLVVEPQDSAQSPFGLQEAETHPFIRKMLRQARRLIDVGAEKGEMVLLLARNCIESLAADMNDDGRIGRHAALNGIALGPLLDVTARYVGTAAATNVVSLDTLARRRQGAGFVKIDVDGAEVDVLESGRALLADKRASFLVETHSAALEQGCVALLTAAGYDVKIVDKAWWRSLLPELRPIAHNRWLTAEPPSA